MLVFLCLYKARQAGGGIMFWTCLFVCPSACYHICEHNFLKMNEPILIPIGSAQVLHEARALIFLTFFLSFFLSFFLFFLSFFPSFLPSFLSANTYCMMDGLSSSAFASWARGPI